MLVWLWRRCQVCSYRRIVVAVAILRRLMAPRSNATVSPARHGGKTIGALTKLSHGDAALLGSCSGSPHSGLLSGETCRGW